MAFDLHLQGIGSGNGENPGPKTTQRTLTIEIWDSRNQKIAEKTGSINYNEATKNFASTVDVGKLTPGDYTLKIKTNKYLKKLIPGIYQVPQEPTTPITVQSVKLIVGDINNDNKIDLLDYNEYLSCVGKPVSGQCVSTDLNDDGLNDTIASLTVTGSTTVQYDLRLLLENFGSHEGD